MLKMTLWLSLPGKGCAQNSRAHPHAKARDVKAHRAEAMGAALAARLGLRLPAPAYARIAVTATWFMAPCRGDDRYRPWDSGNAQGALKAALDGLVDAGLVADDRGRMVEQRAPALFSESEDHEGRMGVELEIVADRLATDEERREFRLQAEQRALRAVKRAAGKGRR